MNDLERGYINADAKLAKVEKELNAILEKLALARAERHAEETTKLRVKAQELEREVESALEDAHETHRAYWTAQARLAEKKLTDLALPLMGEIDAARKACGGMCHNAALGFLQHLAHTWLPPFVAGGNVPLAPPDSKVLDRAEDEI